MVSPVSKDASAPVAVVAKGPDKVSRQYNWGERLSNLQDMAVYNSHGRNYVFSAAFSSLKSAVIGLAAIPVNVLYFQPILAFKATINTLSGVLIGTIDIGVAIILDSIKVVAQAWERHKNPAGHKALLVIDVQNDFIPGVKTGSTEATQFSVKKEGSLAVKGALDIVKPINKLGLAILKQDEQNLVVASKDFHPVKHCSFFATFAKKSESVVQLPNGQIQFMWPTHCVQGTKGVEFVTGLVTQLFGFVINKGLDLGVDSYGAFADNGDKNESKLAENLRGRNIKQVFVVGLAYDFCVQNSAIQSAKRGFETYVIEDATKGVGVVTPDLEGKKNEDGTQKTSIDQAKEDMLKAGVKLITAAQALKDFGIEVGSEQDKQLDEVLSKLDSDAITIEEDATLNSKDVHYLFAKNDSINAKAKEAAEAAEKAKATAEAAEKAKAETAVAAG